MADGGDGLIFHERSLVVPVYRNEENIDDLLDALNVLHRRLGGLEVVFVVDGSPDRSGELLLARRENMRFAAQILFHSRNFGAFAAIRTGLEYARGRFLAVMAADLQEPPELIERMFSILEADGADVVFGQRIGRHDSLLRDAFSNLFWWLYRKLVISSVPRGGVDIFACNRRVTTAVLEIVEPNSSLIAQLFWVGFRREFVPYERMQRTKGTSAWGVSRRIRYMMDSIFSFSDLPILLVLWFGLFGCVASAAFGLFVATARLLDFVTVPGYTGLVLLVTFGVSAILLTQGVLGAYLWRTFENTKRRPLRIIGERVMWPHQTELAASEENNNATRG